MSPASEWERGRNDTGESSRGHSEKIEITLDTLNRGISFCDSATQMVKELRTERGGAKANWTFVPTTAGGTKT